MMKKLLDKAKQAARPPYRPVPFDAPKIPPQQDPTISPPVQPEIIRYRYNHGTNLGSIYVLEKWLRPSMFPKSCGDGQSSELEAAKANIKELGVEKARKKLEDHWSKAMSREDWEWLSGEAKCTAIRLPIGYFTLGPKFCSGTPFASVSKLYQNSWDSVRRFVNTANSFGIGVLLDLHALPGGANDSDHSGTNSGKAELWDSNSSKDLAVECLNFLASEVKYGLYGVVGIQVCNEAQWGAKGIYDFYDRVLTSIHSIDPDIPIYISDAWNLSEALPYALKRNAKNVITNPVIIDMHYYWAFTDADKAKTPQQIIDEVPSKLNELDGQECSIHDRGGIQVVVGEFSCVMAGEVWNKHGEANREQLCTAFGQAQTRRWQQKTGGSYFWTYKMDWLPGGEWGFIDQTKKGALSAPTHFSFSFSQIAGAVQNAASQRDSLAQKAASEHASYWDNLHPGGTFEHWRFEPGWQTGYSDAEVFFTARLNGLVPRGRCEGGDRIGALEAWVMQRCRQSGMTDSGWMWEWEAGLRRGVRDFENVVGIQL